MKSIKLSSHMGRQVENIQQDLQKACCGGQEGKKAGLSQYVRHLNFPTETVGMFRNERMCVLWYYFYLCFLAK
jgi:hypothetical protein